MAPTQFIMNNRPVSKSLTSQDENRELYPMKKYKVSTKDDDDVEGKTNDVINICFNEKSNSEESLSGLIWNEKDSVSDVID